MTSYPQPGAPHPRNRSWTVVAVAVFAIGLVLSGFFGWKAIDNRPSVPEPIGAGPVQLDREGLTVYSTEPVLQPRCRATDSSGADVPLKRPVGTEQITVNSRTWYVALRSADPVPPGAYSVTCGGGGGTYSVGARASVLAFVGSLLAAIGSFVLFGFAGVLILVLAAVKRRRAKVTAATFAAPPPYPGAPGQPYPQPYPGAPGQPYPGPPQSYPGSPQSDAPHPGRPPQPPGPEYRPG